MSESSDAPHNNSKSGLLDGGSSRRDIFGFDWGSVGAPPSLSSKCTFFFEDGDEAEEPEESTADLTSLKRTSFFSTFPGG